MKTLIFSILLMSLSQVALAELCQSSRNTQRLGSLDHSIVNEASGLAISRQFEDRFYHINDSGDGPYFYVTDEQGAQTKRIEILGFEPKDVEDLAYGNCYKNTKCLFIGDIGDNAERRENVKILSIIEQDFSEEILTYSQIVARYPDRAHNAEGMALHPNGDLYILTKEVDYLNNRAATAMLFKLTKEQLEEGGEQELEFVANFELPYILYLYNLFGRIVTAFDISPDGERLLILTYKVAIEVKMNLEGSIKPVRDWKQNEDYVLIETESLPQQEAVAYTPNGKGFVYNTEYHETFGEAPLFRVDCQE